MHLGVCFWKPSLRSGELETDLRGRGVRLPGTTTQMLGSPVYPSNIRRARMALGHKQKQLLRGSKRVHFLFPMMASLQYGCMETTQTDPFSSPPPFPSCACGDPAAFPVLTHRCLPATSESVLMGTLGTRDKAGEDRTAWASSRLPEIRQYCK